MTTTKQLSREDLLQQAREAEAEEVAYLDQLSNIGPRVREAKRDAEGRFAVQNAERLSGRSTDEPKLDFSEAQSILNGESAVREKAKQAGIVKLRALAAVHEHDGSQHAATFENLGEPLADLEAQKTRIENDYRAVHFARMTAARKRDAALDLARQFGRAAALAESASEPIRRM